ncbi:hypothetical protein F183_A14160 [Bryobacterales bacterium F-183]|nr:hypothetical protein F183_A14160 [Bryobacterales bacterium F-183]
MTWVSLLLASLYGIAGLYALAGTRNLWRWTFILSAGIPLGLGVSGLIYLAVPAFHLAVDALLLLATAYLAWRKTPADDEPWQGFAYNWILALAAAAAMAFVLASVYSASTVNPHGDWDAWAIWNLRAKYLAGPIWQHAVATEIAVQHPDYPLLLSAIIARAWKDGGNTFDPAVPATIAMLFFACGAGLLASAVACIRRSSSLGWLSLLILAASSSFISQVPSQYADIPLAVYMAAAIACALLDVPIAGGLFAGLAANTKNEGIAFAAAYLIATLVRTRRPHVLCGAIPGIAAIVTFKAFYAPVSEYLGRTPDFSRLGAIIESSIKLIPDLGFGLTNPLLLLLVLVAGLRWKPAASPLWFPSVLVFLVMKFAYLTAYLTTPADVQWQLGTSQSRLAAQLWLMLILLVLVRLRSLEEIFAAVAPRNKKQPSGRA